MWLGGTGNRRRTCTFRETSLAEELAFDDFADLHDARTIRVITRVGNELACRGVQSAFHLGHGAEEQVTHGVVGWRRSGRKPSDPPVHLRAHEPTRVEKLTRQFKMPAEVVVLIETGPGNRGIHYAESDHDVKIPLVAVSVLWKFASLVRNAWKRACRKNGISPGQVMRGARPAQARSWQPPVILAGCITRARHAVPLRSDKTQHSPNNRSVDRRF